MTFHGYSKFSQIRTICNFWTTCYQYCCTIYGNASKCTKVKPTVFEKLRWVPVPIATWVFTIVEKQFSCSFKVQVLAVILLNTQLKVQYSFNVVDIFSNTVHKYRSIKYSSKQFHKYKSIKYSNKLHIKYNVHSSISIQSNPYVQVHSIQLHVPTTSLSKGRNSIYSVLGSCDQLYNQPMTA